MAMVVLVAVVVMLVVFLVLVVMLVVVTGGVPDQGGISQVLQQHLAGYPRETGEVRGRSSCCNLEATLTRQP